MEEVMTNPPEGRFYAVVFFVMMAVTGIVFFIGMIFGAVALMNYLFNIITK